MADQSKNPSAVVLTFGKHKGSTVAELLARDPAYAEWIVNQGWVAERFAELHAAIMARGAAPDDSPEHNQIQGRFLDRQFCLAFLKAADPVLEYSTTRFGEWFASLAEKTTFKTQVSFEDRGIDVKLWFGSDAHLHHGKWSAEAMIGIEIKPSLGDDFPSVMRQMSLLGCRYLVVAEYTGRGVSSLQLREMFQANGITIIFMREIESEVGGIR